MYPTLGYKQIFYNGEQYTQDKGNITHQVELASADNSTSLKSFKRCTIASIRSSSEDTPLMFIAELKVWTLNKEYSLSILPFLP